MMLLQSSPWPPQASADHLRSQCAWLSHPSPSPHSPFLPRSWIPKNNSNRLRHLHARRGWRLPTRWRAARLWSCRPTLGPASWLEISEDGNLLEQLLKRQKGISVYCAWVQDDLPIHSALRPLEGVENKSCGLPDSMWSCWGIKREAGTVAPSGQGRR